MSNIGFSLCLTVCFEGEGILCCLGQSSFSGVPLEQVKQDWSEIEGGDASVGHPELPLLPVRLLLSGQGVQHSVCAMQSQS